MTEYHWKQGARQQAGARVVPVQIVGERLEQLREEADGLLTPDAVLDDAAAPESPLHAFFEWDDTEAARLHRVEQARGLIRSVVVKYRTDNTEEKSVRAFVNVTRDDEPGYTTSVVAMSDADMRAQVVRKAWNELQAFRRRYSDLVEFARLFATMEEIDAIIPPRIAA